MNFHHARRAVALTGFACTAAALLVVNDAAVPLTYAAGILLAVSAFLLLTRMPRPESSRWCSVCEQRPGVHEYGGMCSTVCMDAHNSAVERQDEEDLWWRAIA